MSESTKPEFISHGILLAVEVALNGPTIEDVVNLIVDGLSKNEKVLGADIQYLGIMQDEQEAEKKEESV